MSSSLTTNLPQTVLPAASALPAANKKRFTLPASQPPVSLHRPHPDAAVDPVFRLPGIRHLRVGGPIRDAQPPEAGGDRLERDPAERRIRKIAGRYLHGAGLHAVARRPAGARQDVSGRKVRSAPPGSTGSIASAASTGTPASKPCTATMVDVSVWNPMHARRFQPCG